MLSPCHEIIQKTSVLPPVNSDHCCPYVVVKTSQARNHSFKRTLFNYNKLDTIKYIDSLRQTDWNAITSIEVLNDAAKSFSDKINEVARQCMPSKTVKISDRVAPWMTEEIRILINKKKKIHKKAKVLDSLWCWE